MLNVLLNTKLRKKLMGYAFTHTDEDYHVRGLATLINVDPGNLSRELKKFENEGLFHSRTRGNAKFYSINKEYPLYKSLKDIIFKTEGVQGCVKNLINQFPKIITAFIYGSYAKGTEKKSSDIDLFLVGTFTESRLIEKLRKLETKLNREINYSSYTEPEFKKEKMNKGGFLNLILNKKIILLKGSINE
ncbi:MAG: nucleotidyltransferase domain-containing protein [Alphaproteobacteria bacterium]